MKVKNWTDFQHYKDRSPPWIKLHKGLLDNYEFQCLPVASRALAPMLWLLASESEIGEIDPNPKKIAFRLRMSEKEVSDALKPLIEAGFLIVDSTVLAVRKQDACLETERETETEEETEREKKVARATRLSADWVLPDGWIVEAIRIKSDWTPEKAREVAAGFKDYWLSASGQNARKHDWLAAWRNWVRRQKDERTPYQTQKQINDGITMKAIMGSLYPEQPLITGNTYDSTC